MFLPISGRTFVSWRLVKPWLVGIVITLLLLLPSPGAAAARRWPQLMRELHDFGHPVALAWLAHVVLTSLRSHFQNNPTKALLWTLGCVTVYSAAMELVQGLVDRQPSLLDFLNGMLGAGTVLLLQSRAMFVSHATRKMAAMAAASLAVLAAAPLTATLAAYGYRSALAPVLWREGSSPLKYFSQTTKGPRSELAIWEPLADWRGYTHLVVEITNPMTESQAVIVRVHDLKHDLRHEDRYNGLFELTATSLTTLHIPLSTIRSAPAQREMDLSAIRGIIIFSPAATAAGFRVHEIRLVTDSVDGRRGNGQHSPLPTP